MSLRDIIVPSTVPVVANPRNSRFPLASLSEKVNHTEPTVSEALVQHTAQKLQTVLKDWSAPKQPVAGLNLKILDGNFFAGTDKRLQVTRKHGAAALPSMVVCVKDHARGLISHLFMKKMATLMNAPWANAICK
jgi:hypothetical protein